MRCGKLSPQVVQSQVRLCFLSVNKVDTLSYYYGFGFEEEELMGFWQLIRFTTRWTWFDSKRIDEM
jgi:hypothetical protein